MYLEYVLVLLIIFQPILNRFYMMIYKLMKMNSDLSLHQSKIYVKNVLSSIDTYLLFISITFICGIYTFAFTVEILFKAKLLPLFWKNMRNSIKLLNSYVSRGIWCVCLPFLMLNPLLTKMVDNSTTTKKLILYFGFMSLCFSMSLYTIAKILRIHIDPEAILTIDTHLISKCYKPLTPQPSPIRYLIKGIHHSDSEINIMHKVTLNSFASNMAKIKKGVKLLTLTIIKNFSAYICITIAKLLKVCGYLFFIILVIIMTYVRLSPQILTISNVKKFVYLPHYNYAKANATIYYGKLAFNNLIINSSRLTLLNNNIWPYVIILLIWIILIVLSLEILSKILTKHHGKNFKTIQASFTHGEYMAVAITVHTFMLSSLLYIVYWIITNKLLSTNHQNHISFDFETTMHFYMIWILWHPILLIYLVLLKPYNNIVVTIFDIIWPYGSSHNKQLKSNGNKFDSSVKHFFLSFTLVSLICLFTFSSITSSDLFTFLLGVILDFNRQRVSNYNSSITYVLCKRFCLLIYWVILTSGAFYFCLKQKPTQNPSGVIPDNSDHRLGSFKLICRRKCFHAIALGIIVPGLILDATLTCLATVTALVLLLEIELLRFTHNNKNNRTNVNPSKTLSYVIGRFNDSYRSFLDPKDSQAPFVLSHVYLLLGTSLPVWLWFWTANQAHNHGSKPGLAAWAGLLSVGLGDSISALAGSYAKAKSRFYYPLPYCSTGKSITGCLASLLLQSCALAALKTVYYGISYEAMGCLAPGFWGKSVIALALPALLEGYTGQNDNLVIPICTFYTLSHL